MTHTAEQFRTARFATHPDGRIAARVEHAIKRAWCASRLDDYAPERFTDDAMAADGWSPLDETRLPHVVTDDECRYCDERAEPCEDQHTRMGYKCTRPYGHTGKHVACAEDEHEVARWEGAAPTTDEADTSVDYHAMWWKAEKEREQAEAFAARWKETARRAVQTQRTYIGVARDERRARQVAEQERDTAYALNRQWQNLTAREHLDAAWEAAHVPADGTIPAGSRVIARDYMGVLSIWPLPTVAPASASGPGHERRLLDPPTPTRPEGAEAVDDRIEDWVSTLDQDPDLSGADDRRALADFLAERGVRAPEAER